MKSYKELLESVKQIFQEESFLNRPVGLYEPIDYTLKLGGKRIRPVMLLAANQMFGGSLEDVRYAAIGIETFHNFTLLHDDLMDKSPIRRGKATVYTKWNENVAILSGDTMFALAWRYMLKNPHHNLHNILNTFNETAIGVCEGQQFDMEFEQRNDVTIEEYIEMIRLKTAVLLAGALKIGALYADAPAADVDNLYEYGIHLGLAFQLQDDMLDAYGDEKTFGKKTGSDIRDNKKTFLYLRALEIGSEKQKMQLVDLFSTTPSDPEPKVEKVLDIYREIGMKKHLEEAIEKEFAIAKEYLSKIQLDNDRKAPLEELTNALLGREK